VAITSLFFHCPLKIYPMMLEATRWVRYSTEISDVQTLVYFLDWSAG
jgi:hypothetical protein